MTIYLTFNNLTWTDPSTHPYTYPNVGSVSTNHKSSNRIQLSRLDDDLLDFNDLTWTDPLTHPSTQPPTHPYPSKGGSVSTNHKSSNRIELSRLDQVLLKCLWFHMFWPTNPPIHPPTKKNTHPWVGNSPHIPNLQTESKYLNSFKSYCVFTDLGGYPLGVGSGGGVGWGHPPHTCACTCICMHAHTHAHTHACMLNMINMAASMVAAICNFLTCLS